MRYRINEALEKTNYLIQKLGKTPQIELAFKPIINIIGFRHKKTPIADLVKKLRIKGWQLSLYSDFARIVVMPHVTKKMIEPK